MPTHDALMALVFTVDRALVLYLLPINTFLALSVVALIARQRKPLELFAMFVIAFMVFGSLIFFMFHVVVQRPFIRLEVIG